MENGRYGASPVRTPATASSAVTSTDAARPGSADASFQGSV